MGSRPLFLRPNLEATHYNFLSLETQGRRFDEELPFRAKTKIRQPLPVTGEAVVYGALSPNEAIRYGFAGAAGVGLGAVDLGVAEAAPALTGYV